MWKQDQTLKPSNTFCTWDLKGHNETSRCDRNPRNVYITNSEEKNADIIIL